MQYDLNDRLITEDGQYLPDGGFTLVELLVTIALLIILVTVALPGMSSYVADIESWSTANQQQSLLSYTRNEAIRCSCEVVMCSWDGADGCTGNAASGTLQWTAGALVYRDLDRDRVLDKGTDPVLRVLAFEPSVTVTWNKGERLIYEGDGSVRGASNGTFTLTRSGSDPRKLILSRPGRVRRD